MDKQDKSKKPAKLALLSVPLAVASPMLADLPVEALESSQYQKNSAGPDLARSASNKQVAANLPQNLKGPTVSSYRVRSGDTVSKIAKRFGVSVNKIARLNNLGPNSLIRVGQILKLTGQSQKPISTATYKVRSGDTLTKIAKLHELSVNELVAINGITSSTIIYPGQLLRVAKVLPAPVEVSAESHEVVAGETLAMIAKKYGLTPSLLRSFNGLTKNSIIYVGQVLSLKPVAPTSKETVVEQPILENPTTNRPSGKCEIHGYHTVKAGETVSKIASVYGVSTQSVLTQNQLSWSSTIYVGQKLQIPGVHEIQHCPSIAKLSNEMRPNAEVIYRVGKSLGVSDFGIVIALATAMQESSLRNIDFGDRDSVGLFQQRPSQGWGTVSQIMNPEYAARAFFGGPTGPNFGKVRGLLEIKNWQNMSLTKAAQAVQISAFPDAYQKWEVSAWVWFDELSAKADLG